MPMKPYPIRCYATGCNRPAALKIAARWSDGRTRELKTYSLSCEECVETLLAGAVIRHKQCRLTDDETLEAPEVFDLPNRICAG